MLHLLLQISWDKTRLPIGNERLTNLLWCVGIILVSVLLRKPMGAILTRGCSIIAQKFTEKQHGALFSALLRRPLELLLQTLLFYVALNQLNILLSQFILKKYRGKDQLLYIRFGDVVDVVFLFLAILFATLLLSRIIDFAYRIQQDKAIEAKNRERQQMLPLLKDVAKLVLWTIGIFWILGSVFQVNIPALITGLGIGGVAIALAAKESVENLFAAFTILSDKPFQTGDLIRVGTYEGNVERIGFRSTRLRSADGSAYIVPNKKLVMENVENLSDRVRRRIKTTVNIKYGISHSSVDNISKEIEQMLARQPQVLKPIEILLNGFAENVFQLDVSYYVANPLPHDVSLNALKQSINLHVYEVVNKYTDAGITVDNNKPERNKNDDKGQKEDPDES
jgi:MscS family membrane protein